MMDRGGSTASDAGVGGCASDCMQKAVGNGGEGKLFTYFLTGEGQHENKKHFLDRERNPPACRRRGSEVQ